MFAIPENTSEDKIKKIINDIKNEFGENQAIYVWLKHYVGEEWNKLEKRAQDAEEKLKKVDKSYFCVGCEKFVEKTVDSNLNLGNCSRCERPFCGETIGCKGSSIYYILDREPLCKKCAIKNINVNHIFEQIYDTTLAKLIEHLDICREPAYCSHDF